MSAAAPPQASARPTIITAKTPHAGTPDAPTNAAAAAGQEQRHHARLGQRHVVVQGWLRAAGRHAPQVCAQKQHRGAERERPRRRGAHRARSAARPGRRGRATRPRGGKQASRRDPGEHDQARDRRQRVARPAVGAQCPVGRALKRQRGPSRRRRRPRAAAPEAPLTTSFTDAPPAARAGRERP